MANIKKTILITGGAGFVGSHYLDNIMPNEKYEKVIVIDNLSVDNGTDDKKANFKHHLDNPKLKFYEVDIKDKDAVEKIFQDHKPHIVVHFAAIGDVRKAVDSPQKYIDTNITGTLNLLESSKNISVEKFIFISTSTVYGNRNKAPFEEKMLTHHTLSAYPSSKIAGELLAHTYHHNFKLPVAVLRIFNAYGPRLRPGLVMSKWAKAILSDETIEMSGKGTIKRDFTYIGDIVEAVNKTITKKIEFDIFNIGNSKPVALKDLLKIMEKVIGKKAIVKSRPTHNASLALTHASTKKAKKILGWAPKTKFEDGIKKFVTWYKENRQEKK